MQSPADRFYLSTLTDSVAKTKEDVSISGVAVMLYQFYCGYKNGGLNFLWATNCH